MYMVRCKCILHVSTCTLYKYMTNTGCTLRGLNCTGKLTCLLPYTSYDAFHAVILSVHGYFAVQFKTCKMSPRPN